MKALKILAPLFFVFGFMNANSQIVLQQSIAPQPAGKKIQRFSYPATQSSNGRSSIYETAIDYDLLEEHYSLAYGLDYQRNFWKLNANYTTMNDLTLGTAAVLYDSLFYFIGSNMYAYHPLATSTVLIDSVDIHFKHERLGQGTDTIRICIFDGPTYAVTGTGPAAQLSVTCLWDTVLIANDTIPTYGQQFTVLTLYPDLQLAQGQSFGIKVDFFGDTLNTLNVVAGYRDDCGSACLSEQSIAGPHAIYYLNASSGSTNISGVYQSTPAGVYFDCDQSGALTPGGCELFPVQNFTFVPYVTIEADTQVLISIAPPVINNFKARLFRDVNQNNVYDAGDVLIKNKPLIVGPYTLYSTTVNGLIQKTIGAGTYSITAPVIPNYTLTSLPLTFSLTLTAQTDTLFDFAYQVSNYSDSASVISEIAPTVCSNSVVIWVDINNAGTIDQTLRATLVVDSAVTMVSASGASSVSAYSATWTATALEPLTYISYAALLQLPNFSFMGDTMEYTVNLERLDTSGWKSIGNYVLRRPIVCSYDPNDKTAYPQGEVYQHYTLMNTPLHYTVRFQNTGNFPAVKVEIRDTLDAGLNYSTFRLLSASHPVEVAVENNRYVSFVFNNINLPDSGSNEPGSHGYVSYSIEPALAMVPGTTVENTAHIYFDFNPAVVTNTTETEYVTQFPTGISTISADGGLTAVPNPFTESTLVSWKGNTGRVLVKVYNLQGEVVLSEQASGNNIVINKGTLHAGVYLVQVTADAVYSMKLMVK